MLADPMYSVVMAPQAGGVLRLRGFSGPYTAIPDAGMRDRDAHVCGRSCCESVHPGV